MKRVYAIDFLKYFAAFAVVVIHANPFEYVPLFGLEGERVDLIVETLMRWAVPFFFMASGYFFGKKVTPGEANPNYLKRYVASLVKLYATWTAFYLAYDFLMTVWRNGSIAEYIQAEKWSWLNFLYLGSPTSAPHLWYLTALTWSIVIIYVFNRRRQLNLLLGIGLFLNLVGIFDAVNNFSTRETLFVGLFYTASGTLLAQREEHILAITHPRLFFLIPLLFLLQVVERLTLFSGDYYLSTIPLVWLLFLFALRNRQLGHGTVIARIGANSDGIYLIHWLLLKLLLLGLSWAGWEAARSTLAWALLFPPFLFLLSYWAFEPVRYLKWKLFPK